MARAKYQANRTLGHKKRIAVVMPSSLRDKLSALAIADGRSLNGYLVTSFKAIAVNAEEKANG